MGYITMLVIWAFLGSVEAYRLHPYTPDPPLTIEQKCEQGLYENTIDRATFCLSKVQKSTQK